MAVKTKPSKVSFSEVLVSEIEEYIDKAFDTNDSELREKYRKAICQMENLIITISDLN